MTNNAAAIDHSPLPHAPVALFMTITGVKQGAIRGHAGATQSERIPVLAVAHEIAVAREGGSASGASRGAKKPLVITVPMGFSFPALYDAASNSETLSAVTISSTAAGNMSPDWVITATNATIMQVVLDAQNDAGKDNSSLCMTLSYQNMIWRKGAESVQLKTVDAN